MEEQIHKNDQENLEKEKCPSQIKYTTVTINITVIFSHEIEGKKKNPKQKEKPLNINGIDLRAP